MVVIKGVPGHTDISTTEPSYLNVTIIYVVT